MLIIICTILPGLSPLTRAASDDGWEDVGAGFCSRHTLPTVKWFGAHNQNMQTVCSIDAQKQTLQTLCSIGAQNANSNTLWTKLADHRSAVMRNFTRILYSKLIFPHWREYAEYPQNLHPQARPYKQIWNGSVKNVAPFAQQLMVMAQDTLGNPQVARPISLLTSSL